MAITSFGPAASCVFRQKMGWTRPQGPEAFYADNDGVAAPAPRVVSHASMPTCIGILAALAGLSTSIASTILDRTSSRRSSVYLEEWIATVLWVRILV